MKVEIGTGQADRAYYWGEDGQYGPFDIQEQGLWAGWPHFGQVMRYFRKKARKERIPSSILLKLDDIEEHVDSHSTPHTHECH